MDCIVSTKSPAELRSMFGENLRQLSTPYGSVSDLSRQLGINRTQFNRYLAGESFPRPDVLARICKFFNVDARVLLEPVSTIGTATDPFSSPFLRGYVTGGAADVPERLFPSGFYRFSRRSFTKRDVFILSVVFIRRDGPYTIARGYESIPAMRYQDFPTTAVAREYRGIVMQQENGIVIMVSRKNAMTSSFNYLNQVASFDNNFWSGYVTRTVPETEKGLRATRLVYEYLGTRAADALPAARESRFHTTEELPPFHRRLLQPDKPFA